MEIYEPIYLNELGKRSNNEDAIFPNKASTFNELFLVCDGVGGQDKGEVASRFICEFLPQYFENNQVDIHDKGCLESALEFVEQKMNDYIKLNIEASKMASTLTLLCLSKEEDKALIGWVGDSRVYHIRDGKILFQTKDHSEVQSLVDMGEISEQEAENHPRKNIITRAVSGKDSTRIDQKIIGNIKANDYFLLCTDGILENLKKLNIQNWFVKENTPEEIKSLILNNALNNTKDNFSMYLIKVKEVNKKNIFDFFTSFLLPL
ncbi:serine/threonine-protein phosphatase [Aureibaculum algae]|uniref:Serine/threonine-protein phosphatase n=1 Tax=Aureibaculum algae TaxID=2584122 RepID=A0A5B7TT06_9FLAO|nr:protein phosphatase 2C domain-containing protein [Aureibaculum algae]QCX38354.1 serine/threonine-protein phosphatase [Aureibaculum algae]